LMIGLVSLSISPIPVSITVFSICFVSIGLFFAFLYKEIACPHEYYFYYNRGISKIKLIFFCLFVSILPSALILIILHYVVASA
jgi:hypothetical protein